MKFYIESYGCSMNTAESEQLIGFLVEQNFLRVQNPTEADYLIINTCAVKQPTEFKMFRRINALNEISKKSKAKLVVCGCLPKINEKKLKEISKTISFCGPSLADLSKILKIEEKEFSPKISGKRFNEKISIIPIAKGCLNNCSFCGTKIARGNLKSYSVKELAEKFEKNLLETKEIWLTGQDTGCYGKDIGTNLPTLLKRFLKSKKNFRIRIGMMSPQYAMQYFDEYSELFENERLYKFFHLPIQSGSNKILNLMKRPYAVEKCIELIEKIRSRFPNATISTDIIAGFPTETEEDFKKTIELIEQIQPDIVNISRYGKRPNTIAAEMKEQVSDLLKKERSRILTRLCRKIAFERNKRMVGKIETILISEKGKNETFVGRSQNYKAVVLKKKPTVDFVRVKIVKAMPTYLVGKAQ